MEASVVTSKGQIVIPVKLRKKTGIKEGTRVYLEEKDGEIVIHPATADYYKRTQGLLSGGKLVETLEASRRRDRIAEENKIERH